MTVYVAWTSADLDQIDPSDLAGPWREVRVAAGALAFVDSDETLSAVYHALKWSLPPVSPSPWHPWATFRKPEVWRRGRTAGFGHGSGEVP